MLCDGEQRGLPGQDHVLVQFPAQRNDLALEDAVVETQAMPHDARLDDRGHLEVVAVQALPRTRPENGEVARGKLHVLLVQADGGAPVAPGMSPSMGRITMSPTPVRGDTRHAHHTNPAPSSGGTTRPGGGSKPPPA